MARVQGLHANIIYGLVDPETNQIRYVGKSTIGLERPKSHYYPSKLKKPTHSNHWIKLLLNKGLRPDIIVLDIYKNGQELGPAEIKWIAHCKALGLPLTNETDGGEGQLGRIFSPETCAKISIATTGKKRTPETCARISEAMLGHKRCVGRQYTPESKSKMQLNQPTRKPIVDQHGTEYASIHEAGRILHLGVGNISAVLHGRYKQMGGYVFKYLDRPQSSLLKE